MWNGIRRTYIVQVLDGGEWDRSTNKAWCDSLDEALTTVAQMKEDNPNYRDYGEPKRNELIIAFDGKVFDEYVHDAEKLANRIVIKLLTEQSKGWDFVSYPLAFLSIPVSSGITLSTVETVAEKLAAMKVTNLDDDTESECFLSTIEFGKENDSIDMRLEVNEDAVPYLFTLTMIREF